MVYYSILLAKLGRLVWRPYVQQTWERRENSRMSDFKKNLTPTDMSFVISALLHGDVPPYRVVTNRMDFKLGATPLDQPQQFHPKASEAITKLGTDRVHEIWRAVTGRQDLTRDSKRALLTGRVQIKIVEGSAKTTASSAKPMLRAVGGRQ